MTLWSIKVNNLFLFVALLVYGAMVSGVEPASAEALIAFLALLLLLPASSDPLAKIPASRFGLWPLHTGQKVALRVGSLLLSPLFWITLGVMWRTAKLSVAIDFAAFVIALQVAIAAGAGLARFAPVWNPLRHIPQFPGPLGGLVRNHLREMVTLLDFYVALAFSVGGFCYLHLTKNPDPSAAAVLSILIALTLSTQAQSLFGLEFGAGMTRYRLLPLRGWEVLLAKDMAFLLVLVLLIAPLAVGPGLALGQIALALGHHSSVYGRIVLKKWRFAGGRLLPVGALQALGGIAAGIAEKDQGATVLIATSALWVGSIFLYGWLLERR